MYGEYASSDGMVKYIFTCIYYTLVHAGFQGSEEITKSYMNFRLFNKIDSEQLNYNLVYFIDSFVIPEINKLLIFYQDTIDFENTLGGFALGV